MAGKKPIDLLELDKKGHVPNVLRQLWVGTTKAKRDPVADLQRIRGSQAELGVGMSVGGFLMMLTTLYVMPMGLSAGLNWRPWTALVSVSLIVALGGVAIVVICSRAQDDSGFTEDLERLALTLVPQVAVESALAYLSRMGIAEIVRNVETHLYELAAKKEHWSIELKDPSDRWGQRRVCMYEVDAADANFRAFHTLCSARFGLVESKFDRFFDANHNPAIKEMRKWEPPAAEQGVTQAAPPEPIAT